MPSLIAPRALRHVLLALATLAAGAHAQNRRADVRRFQWDPVVVHIGAEAPLGVEVYMSVYEKNWGLTWINPDSLAQWLPQLHQLLASSAQSDSTPWVGTRYSESRMRVVKGVVQGRQAFSLQLRAPPGRAALEGWLSADYARDLAKALDKALSADRDLDRAPQLANAQPVYEEWDVDSLPVGAAEEHFAASLPNYMVRGGAVVGFVVDSAGHVLPSTVTVYDCNDPNLAKQWAREVVAWHFVGGTRGDKRVATRIRMGFTIDTGHSFQVDNQRVVPGRP